MINIEYGIDSLTLSKRENEHIKAWGIKHKEIKPKDETNRTEFRRQRDRILYTGGFRRLQDKTQVIAATKNGDHRTRLTHTLEVEQISVSIADALGLNRDLVSAIALGHDVGHTPFGHAAEKVLNEKLKNKGGFSHAVQSVRYLRKKEIDLDSEILEGILKHDTDVYTGSYNKEQFNCSKYNPSEPGSLEAQVVYWADKLAYLTHDFEDFYHTEIYIKAKKKYKNLEKELQNVLAELMIEEEKREAIKINISNFHTRDLIRNLLRKLISVSLNNIKSYEELKSDFVVGETCKRIQKIENENKKELDKYKKEIEEVKGKLDLYKDKVEYKEDINSLKESRNKAIKKIKEIKKKSYQKGLIINFYEYNNSDKYIVTYQSLRDILDNYYIGSPEVQRSDAKAKKIVESLYEEFTKNSKILPLEIQEKIKSDSNPHGEDKERIAADYIASMTDRYAEEVFFNLNSIGSHYEY